MVKNKWSENPTRFKQSKRRNQMPHRDPEIICQALAELKKFYIYFGDSEYTRVEPIEAFILRFNEQRVTKELISEFTRFKDEIFLQTREQIYGSRFLPGPEPTEEATTAEFMRVFGVVATALHPPKPEPPRLDISKFSGSGFVNTKDVSYLGAADEVRKVVERGIEVVRKHAKALGDGDFETAYRDIGPSSRKWMTLKRFKAVHQEAAEMYGGSPLRFSIDQFGLVLADVKARMKSSKEEGWPASIPKEAKRTTLSGFWIRDAEQHGCHATYWITEEAGEYRIAKFDFWTM